MTILHSHKQKFLINIFPIREGASKAKKKYKFSPLTLKLLEFSLLSLFTRDG
jgi:hypothetical protein